MKKQLLCRYFIRQDSQIPYDSVVLGEFHGDHRDTVTLQKYALSDTICDWLTEHPGGRVDFIGA